MIATGFMVSRLVKILMSRLHNKVLFMSSQVWYSINSCIKTNISNLVWELFMFEKIWLLSLTSCVSSPFFHFNLSPKTLPGPFLVTTSPLTLLLYQLIYINTKHEVHTYITFTIKYISPIINVGSFFTYVHTYPTFIKINAGKEWEHDLRYGGSIINRSDKEEWLTMVANVTEMKTRDRLLRFISSAVLRAVGTTVKGKGHLYISCQRS